MDVRLRRLAEEFDRWAEAGRGEEMAREHRPLLQAALSRMNLTPGDRYLDLGCGIGWASRLLARTVPGSEVVGVDLSHRMIELARAHPENLPTTTFRVADAHHLPFPDGSFSRLVSVESLYYYPDLQAALSEAARVVEPGGSAYFLIDLYLENEATHGWVDRLSVPVHLLSSDEWCHRIERAGFVSVHHERVRDPRPMPDRYEGAWFDDIESFRAYREAGSLLVGADVEPEEGEEGEDPNPRIRRDRFP